MNAGQGSVAQITQAFSQYVGATGTDQQYVDGLKAVTTDNGSPTYTGAVSPWFFTHYGANTYNKNVRRHVLDRLFTVLTVASSVDLLRWIASVPDTLGEHH